ncbi:hypothetical protein B296_00032508, partial [Ensete ventricosum]
TTVEEEVEKKRCGSKREGRWLLGGCCDDEGEAATVMQVGTVEICDPSHVGSDAYYGCCKRDHAVEEEDGSKAEAGVARAKDSSDVANARTAGKDSDSSVVQLRQWARDGSAK